MIGRFTKNRPEAQPPLAEKGTAAPQIVYSDAGVSVWQLGPPMLRIFVAGFWPPSNSQKVSKCQTETHT